VLLGSSNLAVPAIVLLGRDPDASPLSDLLMLVAGKQLVKEQEGRWYGSIYLNRQEDMIEGENGSTNRHRDYPCDQCPLADETAMLMCISCGSYHEGNPRGTRDQYMPHRVGGGGGVQPRLTKLFGSKI
jgi:hypothetical protein